MVHTRMHRDIGLAVCLNGAPAPIPVNPLLERLGSKLAEQDRHLEILAGSSGQRLQIIWQFGDRPPGARRAAASRLGAALRAKVERGSLGVGTGP